MTALTWERREGTYVAKLADGTQYQIIKGRRDWDVWHQLHERDAAGRGHFVPTLVASQMHYLSYAKEYAERDAAKRTHPATYASAAFKKVVEAQHQLRLALDGAESPARETFQVAISQIDVTRDTILKAKRESKEIQKC